MSSRLYRTHGGQPPRRSLPPIDSKQAADDFLPALPYLPVHSRLCIGAGGRFHSDPACRARFKPYSALSEKDWMPAVPRRVPACRPGPAASDFFDRSEAAALEIGHRLSDLVFGVHDERPVHHHRLVDRLPPPGQNRSAPASFAPAPPPPPAATG